MTLYGVSEGEGSAGVHNVVRGDTLYSVSQRYKIAMRDIVQYNSLTPPFALKVGQRIKLPPPREYTVKKGDTIYAVSRIFDISPWELAQMNSMSEPYTLMPGRVLKLPSVAGSQMTTGSVTIAKASSGRAVPVDNVQASSLSSSAGGPKPAAKPRSRITASTPARSSSKFAQPVSGRVVSGYGPKAGGLHNDGVNIAAPRGTPVGAAENGVVVYVGNELKGSGNLILVRHADRWMSAYAHLDSTKVARGQVIKRGDVIGTVGSTGNVTSPQLHFELRRGTQAINPQRYIGA